ncbi:hypothetical protein GCM10008986_30460 [Salinibacillus aidingensis]|uniref:Uncharacterized protein n=1 Tax=Salinibacillus aidingensis TaxID=237684 RepID=A0ABN1BN49_9BACI
MISFLFILEFLFGAVEAFATLLLSITLFRIPFRSIYFRLLLTSFVISGISLLFYNVWNLSFYLGEIVNHSVSILFFFLLVHLKLWESFMVTIAGYLSASIIQSPVYTLLNQLEIINSDLVSATLTSFTSLMTMQFLYAIIVFHLSILFYRYRLGFTLFSEAGLLQNSHPSKKMKMSISIGITLLMTGFASHFAVMNRVSTAHTWMILLAVIASLLSLGFIYLINREHLNDEYEKINHHFH